jgi:uncharacterized protein YndB with AHSA1/START domain
VDEGTNKRPGEFVPGFFQIELEFSIAVGRQRVFDGLTRHVGKWWAYRVGRRRGVMRLEPFVGGRFFEDHGDGEGALWGHVTYIERPKELHISGPLGMSAAVASVHSFELVKQESGTLLRLSHRCAGLIDPHWENAHRAGWTELLGTCLKNYIETGERFDDEAPLRD